MNYCTSSRKICTVCKFLVLSVTFFCGRRKCFKNILSGLQRGQFKKEMQTSSIKMYSILCGLKVFSWKCKLFMFNLLFIYLFEE